MQCFKVQVARYTNDIGDAKSNFPLALYLVKLVKPGQIKLAKPEASSKPIRMYREITVKPQIVVKPSQVKSCTFNSNQTKIEGEPNYGLTKTMAYGECTPYFSSVREKIS